MFDIKKPVTHTLICINSYRLSTIHSTKGGRMFQSIQLLKCYCDGSSCISDEAADILKSYSNEKCLPIGAMGLFRKGYYRNRAPQKNATYGKFDTKLKDSLMTESESISQLSKLFGECEFSPFPHPAAYIKENDDKFIYEDIGLEFIMAKDNLMKELDMLFNSYANDAISGWDISKNIIHCYNSLMVNDFNINEKSKD
ncbi:DgyrCDS14482 [Dimorphilus gyrociliatus]|uniref:DgyrCDS14482 n=1 Tax=Dimorphilus gyrociliatus TaxID=2664684 RepID=A0A7I8WDY4_9ANNE|nr:DgyrCDS14482 [Dimorphilus gyrociliatus]